MMCFAEWIEVEVCGCNESLKKKKKVEREGKGRNDVEWEGKRGREVGRTGGEILLVKEKV
jgi:hypothetical protein